MLPRLFNLVASLGCTTLVTTAGSWSPQLDVGYVFNDNVSNSIRAERDDEAITAAIEFSTLRIINRDWQGNMAIGADTTSWQKFSGLNLSQFHATVGMRRKFGLGPYATKLDLNARGFHQDAKTSPWSGHGYELSATLQKRLSSHLAGSITGVLKRFDSRRAVYAGTNWSGYPNWTT